MFKKTNKSDLAHDQQVKTYKEFRVDQDILLRYMSICTPYYDCFDADQNKKVYSALIILNVDNVDKDFKFLYNISQTEKEADQIMKLLSDNGVTPEVAEEVLNEII
ncbi:MAG: hypothetical protein ACYCWE_02750 [Eubacteriales bacterium]